MTEFLIITELTPKEHTRLFNKIIIDNKSGCWNWQGAKDYQGYGQGFYRGRKERVHRIIYAFFKGKIPRGKIQQLDHLCRNTSCCNPNHLELVSQKVNVLRGEGITAKAARQTHCIHGHLLEKTKNGKRRWCRTCDRNRKH